MRAEVLRHPPPLGDEIDQTLRIEGREQQHAAGLEEILHPSEDVVRIGHVLEDVKEDDGVEGGTGVDEVRDRGAVDIKPTRTRRARGGGSAVDADVFELPRGSVAKAAVAHPDLEDPRARGEV